MSLTSHWQSQKSGLPAKHVQAIGLAGDGKLREGGTAFDKFRAFLTFSILSASNGERTTTSRIRFLIVFTFAVFALLAAHPLSAADTFAATTNASPARTKDNIEFIIGPVYANAPELTVKEGVPTFASTRLPERPDYAWANEFLLKARRQGVNQLS